MANKEEYGGSALEKWGKDLYHSVPTSFDAHTIQNGTPTVPAQRDPNFKGTYTNYSIPATVNKTKGHFNVGVESLNGKETIVHRQFAGGKGGGGGSGGGGGGSGGGSGGGGSRLPGAFASSLSTTLRVLGTIGTAIGLYDVGTKFLGGDYRGGTAGAAGMAGARAGSAWGARAGLVLGLSMGGPIGGIIGSILGGVAGVAVGYMTGSAVASACIDGAGLGKQGGGSTGGVEVRSYASIESIKRSAALILAPRHVIAIPTKMSRPPQRPPRSPSARGTQQQANLSSAASYRKSTTAYGGGTKRSAPFLSAFQQ